MITLYNPISSLLAVTALLFAFGCATPEKKTAGRFLQRENIRIAIVPASNSTQEVSAPIVLDKIWEEHLVENKFIVTNADAVVTYASASGVQLTDLPSMSTAALGKDLNVDYIMFNEIVDWGNSYKVIASRTTVACRSRLVEASTGATIWANDWLKIDDSSDGGGGLIGAVVGAAVHSIVGSMADAASKAAEQGVDFSATTMPYQGIAPVEQPKPVSK